MLHLEKNRLPFAALLAAAALGTAPLAMAEPKHADDAPGHMTETEYGPMLVSRTGMSLYFSAGDNMAKGTSDCTSEPGPSTQPDPTAGLGKYNMVGYKFVKSCLDLWKPYAAPADATASGDWSIFTRPEGLKQWAWQGKPLYFSIRDKAPGEKNGANADFGGSGPTGRVGGFGRGGPNFRFAGYAPFPTLPLGMRVVRAGDALVVADPNGRPLFSPRGGARIQRVCSGCDELQPVEIAWATALDGDWSILPAGAGRQQVAWKGKPVFAAPADMTDEDVVQAGYEQVVYRKLPAPPPEIGKRLTISGAVYTTRSGMTLYNFACQLQGCDLPGAGAAAMSAICSTGKECMRRMRPYLAGRNARAVGDWSIVDLPQPAFADPAGQLYPDGTPTVRAWAYRGKPVFTWYEDKQPGEVWGLTVRWFNAPPGLVAVRVPGAAAAGGRN